MMSLPASVRVAKFGFELNMFQLLRRTIRYSRVPELRLQTTARGRNPAREDIPSDP